MNRGGGGTLSRQCRCRDARGVKEKALRFFKEGGGGGENNCIQPCARQFVVSRHFLFLLLPPSVISKSSVDGERSNSSRKRKPRFPTKSFPFPPTFPLIDDAPSADKENESKENMFKTSFHFHSANNSYLLYIYIYLWKMTDTSPLDN